MFSIIHQYSKPGKHYNCYGDDELRAKRIERVMNNSKKVTPQYRRIKMV